MPTIYRRLVYTLVPALTLLMLAGGYIDYQTSIAAVNSAFDKQMSKEANEIAACITNDAGKLAFSPTSNLEAMLQSGGVSTKLFSVMDANGKLIAGDPGLPGLSQIRKASRISFEKLTIGQRTYRTITLRQNMPATFTVVLAHSLGGRSNTERAMVASTMLVDLVELNVILLVVWLGIHIALRPIYMMQQQMEQQSRLQKFDPTSVPLEIRPFVVTFNHLVELLTDSAMRQRQFLANAAHQLRTPLTGLLAQLQLLMVKPAAQPLREELTTLLNSFDRLKHATNQLLVLARAEESLVSTSHHFQTINIRILIEQTVELYLDRATLAGIDLGAEVQPAEVEGDITLLEDLLNNLVDNALKYTPAGGQVTVRCGTREDATFLEVEDSGPGIPESARIKVRQRFYRQPDASGPGSGLGLAIVEEICRVHRARVTFDPGTNDHGTSVKIIFPK